jgi:hypothetical protein
MISSTSSIPYGPLCSFLTEVPGQAKHTFQGVFSLSSTGSILTGLLALLGKARSIFLLPVTEMYLEALKDDAYDGARAVLSGMRKALPETHDLSEYSPLVCPTLTFTPVSGYR